MRHRLMVFCALLLCACPGATPADTLANFITRRGDRLYDGARDLRVISFNVPNLLLLEDDFAFTAVNNWSLPTTFEIRDAFQSVKEAGGLVVRTYCFRIHKRNEPPFLPKHLTAWRTFYEPAFRVMDTVLALANEYEIRLIIPLLEGPPWWGPKNHFARLRGRRYGFESNGGREDYRHLVGYVLNRRNSVTGTLYKNDKAILCWETGNEMPTSSRWLGEMAAFIKRIDPNHLVMDGNYGVRTAALNDPNVDIVSNHFYTKCAQGISRDLDKINGRKAYIAGEWGWTKEKTGEVIRRTIGGSASGALVWSLRYRYRGGGFTWHKGQGLHWPGGFKREEQRDEREILAAVRNGAFAIRGLTPPPLRPPAPPAPLPINHPSSISWQGSTGALFYTVERAEGPEGPWTVAGDSIDETVVAYRPLFNDTSVRIGKTYYYRVIARGTGGSSAPSAVAGPVAVTSLTLVDELLPSGERFIAARGTSFTDAKPWRFKYDFHRRRGARGEYIEYRVEGIIGGVRIFAFFPGRPFDFTVEISADGDVYSPVIVRRRPFPYCCADPRDRLRLPVLFTVNAPETRGNRVRIVFPRGKAQVGRCEIDYVK
ncbi:MAG: hypothetical protein JW913_11535 [Chitinispirillaceae bacterium]|nr:hypothetical protein [Chitinispirillaceae bacterium]